MTVCSICGKYEKFDNPECKKKSDPVTYDELINIFNSIGCRSFVICSDCSKKYVKEVSTHSTIYPVKNHHGFKFLESEE